MGERIFALDIGTRTVVGLILEKTEDKYELVDYHIEEHDERSMLDGQIHDVVSVANVITTVKEKLEKTHGQLTKVCVAAAGRALKTKRATITKKISEQPIMDKDDILFLEFSAVQKAQHDIALEGDKEKSHNYYCVGYSVLEYRLDTAAIGSLIDQQGDVAEVEIIATFLPKVVVESLLAALSRANLEMDALTLEPIAAINVLIPTSMRRLNVALVDIGAGTSDIALTESGAITAYGMVPVAGDEITEAISDHFLLDFPQAEMVKRQITSEKTAMVTDILGFEQTIDYDQLVDAITMEIDTLVQTISKEIMQLNNKSPKAVMLVGGGSLTPEITNRLAENLNLPSNRVAIRGLDAIQSLKRTDNLPTGPTFVTPIGIAIAAKQNPVHYININVNGKTARLFDMKQLTVGDCLLAAGINIEKLYGKPGMAYIVSFEGKEVTLPGSYGKSPKLTLNNKNTTLETPIKHGDEIIVEKGEDGVEPVISMKELLGEIPSYQVYFNDDKYTVTSNILVNDKQVDENYIIKDHDRIKMSKTKTVNDFLEYINQKEIVKSLGSYYVFVNNKKVTLPYKNELQLNGNNANLDEVLRDGDGIVYKHFNELPVREVLSHLDMKLDYSIKIIFNNKPLTLTKQIVDVYREDNLLADTDEVKCGNSLKTKTKEITPFIFQDIFRFISLDLSTVNGTVKILKNGEPSNFSEELAPNDSITIEW